MEARRWFVTGVSGGLGQALAAAALRRGDRVAGTVRRVDEVDAFVELAPGRATAIVLDLTAPEVVVVAAVDEAVDALGGLDVVVNNAGYGLSGAVEEVSDLEGRHQVETNLFGPWKVIKASLPYLRAQRSGHIVNVSSIAGIRGSGGMGLYCASKFALEGLTESLRAELAPLGINVTAVTPGAFRTRWGGTSLIRAAATIDGYDVARTSSRTIASMDGKQTGDPQRAATAILAAIDAEEPPGRLLLGADAVAVMETKIQGLNDETDRWRELSLSTGFDAADHGKGGRR